MLTITFEKLELFVFLKIVSYAYTVANTQILNATIEYILTTNPANISTSDQRGPTLKESLSDVENKAKSDVRSSTLHNVDTTLVSDVETALKQC